MRKIEELKSGLKIDDYVVLFHTFPSPRPIATANPQVVRGTKCTIKKKGDLVSEVEVFKNHKDEDNKLVARKFALKKAISEIKNKEERTILWDGINNLEQQD